MQTSDLIVRSATLEDAEIAAAFCNAVALTEEGDQPHSADDLRDDWQTPGFDITRDLRLIFTPEGQLVGYGELWMTNTPPAYPFLWARTHPDYRGRGIGWSMLEWAEQVAREYAIPQVEPDVKVTLGSGTTSTVAANARLMTDFGMTLKRSFYTMTIDLAHEIPAPQFPDGITLRNYEGDHDAEPIFRAKDEAFLDHFGHLDEPFETAFATWKHRMINHADFDPSLFFVAMDGDQIAGVTLCTPNWEGTSTLGWINTVGVRRAWRGKGVAQALLYQAFGAFKARGFTEVRLGVDAQSPTGATKLYEKVGMRVLRQWDTYEKELRGGRDLRFDG